LNFFLSFLTPLNDREQLAIFFSIEFICVLRSLGILVHAPPISGHWLALCQRQRITDPIPKARAISSPFYFIVSKVCTALRLPCSLRSPAVTLMVPPVNQVEIKDPPPQKSYSRGIWWLWYPSRIPSKSYQSYLGVCFLHSVPICLIRFYSSQNSFSARLVALLRSHCYYNIFIIN
jgi:hypothetical protein